MLARVRGHYKIPMLMFVAFTLLSVPLAPSCVRIMVRHFRSSWTSALGRVLFRCGRIRTLGLERFLSWWMRRRAPRFPTI